MMGVLTVFLTVTFLTFLEGIGQLSPVIVLQSSLQVAGDFDVLIQGNTEKTERVLGNTNFYVDEYEYFNAPFLSKSDKMAMQTT